LQTLDTPLFPFATVEPALAKTLGYPPSRMLAFRARLRHVQQILGPAAGKGTRIGYSEEAAVRLLLALRLQEHGLSPVVAARLVRDHWETIAIYVRWATDDRGERHPERDGNPAFLALRLRLASGVDDAERVASVGGFRRFDYHLKDAHGLRIERENVALFLDRMEAGEDRELGVLCLHNLTALITRLRSHLGCGGPGVKEPPGGVSTPADRGQEKPR